MAGLSVMKRGGRIDRKCEGCGKPIAAKTSHLWLTRLKRYHTECRDLYKSGKPERSAPAEIKSLDCSEDKTIAPVQAVETTESGKASKEEEVIMVKVPTAERARDKRGHFIKA